MKLSSTAIRTLLKKDCPERDGVFYCSESPADVVPSENAESTNPKKWSVWRKRNFEFYKASLTGKNSSHLVVDLGTGQAHFHTLLKAHRTVGIDFYPYPHVSVVADFSKEIPLKDDATDVLIASNVLEHMGNPKLFLGECNRILKKNGELLLTVPFLINVHQRPYDFYRYTDIALTRLLREAGFRDVLIEPVVDLSALSYNTLAALFMSLSRSPKIDTLSKLFYRAYWFFTRHTIFGFLKSQTRKAAPHEDYPLGYHVRAMK